VRSSNSRTIGRASKTPSRHTTCGPSTSHRYLRTPMSAVRPRTIGRCRTQSISWARR
jgi:hypothetical protein